MIRDVAGIIEYASSFYTLNPGDIFLSGTPGGVGPIRPGDQITASIEKVGAMHVRSGLINDLFLVVRRCDGAAVRQCVR